MDASSPKKIRTVLAPLYIRKLIDSDYSKSFNNCNILTIKAIAIRLQLKHSLNITSEMVFDAMKLEPAYNVNIYYNTLCCNDIIMNK